MAHHFSKISLLAAPPPAPKHVEPYSSVHLSNYLPLFIDPFFIPDWELSEEKKKTFN